MTRPEWKEFWEGFEFAAHEYGSSVYKIEAGGGFKVIVLSRDVESPTPKELEEHGTLVASARYGYRGDDELSHYLPMMKIQWKSEEPVPFGASKTTTVYVTPIPSVVFAILYA